MLKPRHCRCCRYQPGQPLLKPGHSDNKSGNRWPLPQLPQLLLLPVLAGLLPQLTLTATTVATARSIPCCCHWLHAPVGAPHNTAQAQADQPLKAALPCWLLQWLATWVPTVHHGMGALH